MKERRSEEERENVYGMCERVCVRRETACMWCVRGKVCVRRERVCVREGVCMRKRERVFVREGVCKR